MRVLDIIAKKRDKEELSYDEINFLINSYVKGETPDYQISSFLMAVFLNGLSFEETASLTEVMIKSGERYDFSSYDDFFIDKHSTGGVGDKTSLIIAPLIASLGLKVPMMSGRSLGHTGGTLDKLESIKDFNVNLKKEEFQKIILTCGYAMCGQTKSIVPADRLMYSLRDASSTVESIPLISSSILSKKIAEGCSALILDVKTGSGAFMKTLNEARNLSKFLVNTANRLGIKTRALISDMSSPLGQSVGNFLEVEECINCMDKNKFKDFWTYSDNSDHVIYSGKCADLMEISIKLSANMLILSGKEDNIYKAEKKCIQAIESGIVLEKFYENVKLQGGDLAWLKENLGKFRAKHFKVFKSNKDGLIKNIDAYKIGLASVHLKVGRNKTSDKVSFGAGIFLHKKLGEKIRKGEVIFTAYADEIDYLENASSYIESSLELANNDFEKFRGVIEIVD